LDVVKSAVAAISRSDRLIYRNAVTNILGFAVATVISVFNGPIVFRIIGSSEYGLIAVFQLLMSLSNVFDYGVALVLNREVAARSDGEMAERAEAGVALKTVLGSLELLIITVAAIAAVVVISATGWLTVHWFNVSSSEMADARLCLMIGAASLCIQRIRAFGMSVLNGRQRQVELNIWTIVFSLLRMVLGVMVVLLYSPTAIAYLLVQLILSVIEAFLFHTRAWRGVSTGSETPYFSVSYIRGILQPLLANWGAVGAATLLLSADKLALSGFIEIKSYGQYSLVAYVTILLGTLVAMVQSAFLPRLVQAVVSGDSQDLSRTFALFSTIAVALSIPPSMGIAVFGDRIIALLLGATQPIPDLWLVLALLAGGSALSALTRVAHSLQIANSRPDIALKFNVVGLAVYLPLCWLAGHRWGVVGVASAWMIFNIAYLPLFLAATARSVYMGSTGRWLMLRLLMPAAVSLLLFGVAKLFDAFGLYASLASFMVAAGVSALICLLASPDLRQLLTITVRDLSNRFSRLGPGF
jgi:O-antigen/teichoic acid export membrane protein